MRLIDLAGVSKRFGETVAFTALDNVDLVLDSGEFVVIEGPSGSGKSTLLNLVALLDSPSSGTYQFAGSDVTGLSDRHQARLRSRWFAFVFQSFHLLEARTVHDNAEMGLAYRGVSRQVRRAAAMEALEFVGLTDRATERVSKLSGGERQRVAIARAVAARTPIIVADEPTGNLDSGNSRVVVETLQSLHRRGHTIIMVTHDPVVAASASRRIALLDGQIVDDQPTNQGQPALEIGPHRVGLDQTDRQAGASPADLGQDRPVTSGIGGQDEAGPPDRAPGVPVAPGRDSRVRFPDLLRDAWRGVLSDRQRSLSLILAVALGVGLALVTAGISDSARFQVSDLFDSRANRRVALTSGAADPVTSQGQRTQAALAAPAALERLRGLAGVEAAIVLVQHQPITLATHPLTSGDLTEMVGIVDGSIDSPLFEVDTAGEAVSTLADDEVIVGAALARSRQIGPLLTSPAIWIQGQPMRVAGIMTDGGYHPELMSMLIVSETVAHRLSGASFAMVELQTSPGAAPQVALQAPLAWSPADADTMTVIAPPDPDGLRGTIESNVRTVLFTLTGVALALSVLMLTNTTGAAILKRAGEFGLRRALGARRVHVAALVTVESLLTGTLGGIAGAYLGVLSLVGITITRHWQPVIEPELILAGPVGGAAIGLIGGLLAVRRAVMIEPSDALKTA